MSGGLFEIFFYLIFIVENITDVPIFPNFVHLHPEHASHFSSGHHYTIVCVYACMFFG